MTNPIVLRKRKYDGTIRSVWPGDLVDSRGEDWLITFHDARLHHSQPPLAESAAFAIHTIGLRHPLTVLHRFDPLGRFLGARCDAALPAAIAGRTIDFVDLDLDVIVNPDGTHFVRDLDDFRARAVELGYPAHVRRTAWMGILLALRAVRRRQFPFDGSIEAILGRVLAARGPL